MATAIQFVNEQAPSIFSYRKYWAECYGVAPFLPTSRKEMDELGWDSCDIVIISGDAYVDHPSFGNAVIGRLLEAQGFRVGIVCQPNWQSKDDFMSLGQPNLFFGVTAGNMDSMINRYTADRKPRSDDAYSADGKGNTRPDRACLVYAQRCREAYKETPVIIGGIEASLRRLAHYDYWSDKVRGSILADSKADILVFGNGERQIVEIAHRLAAGEPVKQIRDLRGCAFIVNDEQVAQWHVVDSTSIDLPGPLMQHSNPYEADHDAGNCDKKETAQEADTPQAVRLVGQINPTQKRVIRLPSFEQVKQDPALYAHASRVFHKETNPHNASALMQSHGQQTIWLNPPPLPLSTEELDQVFELPYQRRPHPRYGDAKIPAYDMIRFSVNIMRGCFGGCSFCSITEHEGRIIQNRSEESILREVEGIRDKTPGFTGTISDLGGPTANMYRLACKSEEIEARCRKPSCVFPGICKNLNTDHTPLIHLYRQARQLPGIKRVFIASGLRYDLAVESPEYVEELVTHHIGGYLKIAPEHTEDGPLNKMLKPGIGTYDRFKEMFEHYSKKAGKKQYLIPYFIAAHPGSSNEDMMNLALWLKQNGFQADQVQTFIPSPMASASAMYHTGHNPYQRVRRNNRSMFVARGERQRRLQKAFLRYHDPDNWPMLRKTLQEMGRSDLIGNGPNHLIPRTQPTKIDSRIAGADKINRQRVNKMLRGDEEKPRGKHKPKGKYQGSAKKGKVRATKKR